jgi:hypothetical protein
LEELKTRSVRDADQIRLRLIERWAELEPEAALRNAETLSQGSDAQYAAMVSVLAASNPHRAFALLEQSRPSYENLTALFGTWAETNPDEAAAHALKLRGLTALSSLPLSAESPVLSPLATTW